MTDVDIVQVGSGPIAILVHSSVAGARIDNLILLDLNSMAKEKHSPRAWGYAIALRNADMPMNGQKLRRNSLTIGVVQKLGPP